MLTLLDYMEYANDAAAQAAYVTNDAGDYGSSDITSGQHYFCKTVYGDGTEYPPSKAFDGIGMPNKWNNDQVSSDGDYIGIDFTTTKIIRKITVTNQSLYGFKNYKFEGTNDTVTYNDDGIVTGFSGAWNTIKTGTFADNSDVQTVTFANSTAYRYYRIIADGAGYSATNLAIIEIEMMEWEYALQSYSEDTIKTQGTYSLKAIAKQTESLNDTLTRTVDPTISLAGLTQIKFDVYALRTGSHIKIGFHDSGGTTTEITPNILSSNTWQEVKIDLQSVINANKDVIDSIIITIVNADADNTFYIDNMFAYYIPLISMAG